MELRVHGHPIATWNNVGGDYANRVFQRFEFTYPLPEDSLLVISPSAVSVAFTNDGFDNGNDRNLRVDRIQINQATHFSNASTTYSTGTWDPVNGCGPGFKQSDSLHCNGEFRYRFRDAEQFGKLKIFAAGLVGDETLEVQTDGLVTARYTNIGGDANQRIFNEFEYIGPALDVTRHRFALVNDSVGGVDRAVRIDRIEWEPLFGGTPVVMQSEAPETIRTGTFDPLYGCTVLNPQSEWLDCNGYFEYFSAARLQPGDTVIEFDVAGATGYEMIRVGELNFGLPNTFKTYNYVGGSAADREFVTVRFVTSMTNFDASQFKIDFFNDGLAPTSGADINVRVDKIRVFGADGAITEYETEDSDTFSTGTWDAATACAPGFKSSEWLHCNGFFQYEAR